MLGGDNLKSNIVILIVAASIFWASLGSTCVAIGNVTDDIADMAGVGVVKRFLSKGIRAIVTLMLVERLIPCKAKRGAPA